MLINSLPNELLNTKMSYIIEYLSRSNSDLNSSDIKRNCNLRKYITYLYYIINRHFLIKGGNRN